MRIQHIQSNLDIPIIYCTETLCKFFISFLTPHYIPLPFVSSFLSLLKLPLSFPQVLNQRGRRLIASNEGEKDAN